MSVNSRMSMGQNSSHKKTIEIVAIVVVLLLILGISYYFYSDRTTEEVINDLPLATQSVSPTPTVSALGDIDTTQVEITDPSEDIDSLTADINSL